MGIFRSEEMGYYNLMMPAESAYVIMNEIGHLSSCQFVDLNANVTIFNREHAPYLKRCDEAERRLRFFESEMQRFHIIPEEGSYQQYRESIDNVLRNRDQPPNTYIEEVERELQEKEVELINQMKIYEQLQERHNNLKELKRVLYHTQEYLSAHLARQQGNEDIRRELLDREFYQSSGWDYLTGVVHREEKERFKRMIFRASRGNALTLFKDVDKPMEDPFTGQEVFKDVFIIFFEVGELDTLRQKLRKITESGGVKRHEVDRNAYGEQLEKIKSELKQSSDVLKKTKDRIENLLYSLKDNRFGKKDGHSILFEYKWFIQKEKCIYHNLNMFQSRNHIFYGDCWCPTSKKMEIDLKLQNLVKLYPKLPTGQLREFKDKQLMSNDMKPPTHFEVNEFIWPFQELVETYGIANYGEANPTLFTIVTFPFLFGVMFGDIGHGLLLLCFALYIVIGKNSILSTKDHPLKDWIKARYLILLMSLFAIYNGFIYNDCMSIPIDLFGTNWKLDESKNEYVQTDVYPFGMDPFWFLADNKLVFFNSYKMKVSVIIGVGQMTIGVLIKGLNAIYFKKPLDFIFEFIPQLIFMSTLFIYMDFMIIYKWTVDWIGENKQAPNLIQTLVDMTMSLGKVDDPLWGDGSEQESIEKAFFVIAILCVPTMLIFKPCITLNMMKKKHNLGRNQLLPDEGLEQKPMGQEEEQKVELHGVKKQHQEVEEVEDQHSAGEVWIHQMIETIEYVLGTISNTASYLRLWALSLAHAELAEVFFDKCIREVIEQDNPVLLIAGFFIFINATLGVLMCMDAMECFLHALRLHWVEFQNKFYKADGVKFTPFSFEKLST